MRNELERPTTGGISRPGVEEFFCPSLGEGFFLPFFGEGFVALLGEGFEALLTHPYVPVCS